MKELQGDFSRNSLLPGFEDQQLDRYLILFELRDDLIEYRLGFAVLELENIRLLITHVGVARLPVTTIHYAESLFVFDEMAYLVGPSFSEFYAEVEISAAGVGVFGADGLNVGGELFYLGQRVRLGHPAFALGKGIHGFEDYALRVRNSSTMRSA